MKKGLKFWSKLLIASFFLGGMATSAIAQNGTKKANCATELQVITRTVDQMDSIGGTVIPIKFDVTANPGLVGDEVYIVAETNGSLLSLTQTNCTAIGQNLKLVGTGTREGGASYTGTTNDQLADAVATIPDNGIVLVRVNREAGASIATPFKLGVFINDVAGANATQCFSDVYWVSIQVISNIYATLNLHQVNQVAKEYICSGTQTITNIGFDLCGIPASADDAILHYAMTFVDNTGVEGMSLSDGTNTAISGTELYTLEIAPNSGAYSLRIGQQTLTNTSAAVASSVTYRFLEGLDKFYLTYTEGEGANARTINVPILFITNEDNCTGNTQTYTADQMSHEFTVHVAPEFTVEALAYKTEDNRTTGTGSTTTFCQGTVAYLDANTTVTTGANSVITTLGYNWTVADNLDTDANIEQPNSKELVTAGTGAYTFTVTAQWDDAQTAGLASGNWATVNGGAGCKITSEGLVINVTAAPILLVATDKADMSDAGLADNTILWNTTDVITVAETYCPGQEVYINTVETGTPLHDGSNRQNVAESGDYIKHNGASITWTIDVPSNMGAYTEWRVEPGLSDGATGTIAADHASPNTNVTHYLNNESIAAPGNIITYTVQSAGECALVKTDGSSLTDGKVQIKYPVSIRPTFDLSAN